MNTPPYREPQEVFDWAAYEQPKPTARAEVAVRPVHLPQTLPGAPLPEVRYDQSGQPRYAYIPATYPAQDVRGQRLAGGGIFLGGMGVCAVGFGAGSWLFFKGLSLVAVDSVIGLGVIAAAIIYLKMSSGIHIGNVSMGDNSSFNAGSQR